jgi:hypothetical protein
MSTTYYYKVSAYNSYGTSEQSNYAYATTSGSAPSTPTGVTTTASSSSITVSWSSVSGATGYYVYRSTSSSGSYSYRGDLTSTSYTDTGLSANTTYYYKVSAYNSYGTSGQSNYAYATTTGSAPNTPTGITSVASSSSITISWSSVSGATEYYIYRATSSSGSYSYRGYSTSTSYTDTGLSANTTYYYKVSAYNAYGESAQSSYVYETTWSSTSPAPLTGSSLARGIWRDGEIDGQVVGSQKYYFYATAGASYTVFWNDAWNGDGSKTGIVQVYAYWYSNDEDIFWGDNGEDLGYSYGKTFTASRTGYVMITVELYSYFLYKGGTFAIAYQ